MDEMTALDQQIAHEVLREAGPSEPVDGAGIFTAITATQSPKWRFGSMFSATKFIVAAAIVALFGGFLLSGVLMTQPSEEQVPAATASGPGTFSPAGSLSGIRSAHTATLLPDGRVVVAGGVGPGWSVEVWDPETASFASAGRLTTSRIYHEAALLPNGQVLVVGSRFGGSEDTAEVWDPGTEISELARSLPPERPMGSTTILPDGRVLFVGGEPLAASSRLAEIWDPQTATSAPAGTLLEARSGHTATILADGRVLIVGGIGEDWTPLVSAEVWDPATATFSPAGTLTDGRGNPMGDGGSTATLLSDGRVLVVGGSGEDAETPLSSAEIWDPATASFSPAGTLAQGRFMHTASLLPDGRVLVVGGWFLDPDMLPHTADLAEIWDPNTGSFTQGPSLQQARFGHTATVLPDGRVLVIGGETEAESGLGPVSAEVWEPDRGAPRSSDTDADTTTPDLLPGVDLVTEEVEPGVYRVISDGVRDLVREFLV